jgi:hypothetical protein
MIFVFMVLSVVLFGFGFGLVGLPLLVTLAGRKWFFVLWAYE